jgi:hypothetical protein
MNKRERILLMTLLGLLIAVGGWAGYYFTYRKPMEALQGRTAKAQKDYADKKLEIDRSNAEIEQILKRNPHLRQWRQISLPDVPVAPGKTKTPEEAAKHLNEVGADYSNYLNELLRKSGFNAASISVSPKPVENKPTGPNNQAKPSIITRLSFNVEGDATLPAIVEMLRRFHQDHLLQEVQMLSITKPTGSVRPAQAQPAAPVPGAPGAVPAPGGGAMPGGGPMPGQRPGGGGRTAEQLQVKMTVEALFVTGAEGRPELLPKADDSFVTTIGRKPSEYDRILMQNFFSGREGTPGFSKEDPNKILENVRLTTVSHNGRRWEAYLLDVWVGKDELMVSVEGKSDFSIIDKDENIVLSGKAVLIADRTFVFEANGKLYKLTTGEHFYPAIKTPLKDDEIKELGLKPPERKAEAAKPETPVAADKNPSPR